MKPGHYYMLTKISTQRRKMWKKRQKMECAKYRFAGSHFGRASTTEEDSQTTTVCFASNQLRGAKDAALNDTPVDILTLCVEPFLTSEFHRRLQKVQQCGNRNRELGRKKRELFGSLKPTPTMLPTDWGGLACLKSFQPTLTPGEGYLPQTKDTVAAHKNRPASNKLIFVFM